MHPDLIPRVVFYSKRILTRSRIAFARAIGTLEEKSPFYRKKGRGSSQRNKKKVTALGPRVVRGKKRTTSREKRLQGVS